VGQDKGSLTERQTKGTATATIWIRGIHRTNRVTQQSRSPRQDRRHTLSSRKLSSHLAAPPTWTPRDGTWYGISGSVWPGWGWVSRPGCGPSWILLKINPVLAECRTISYTYFYTNLPDLLGKWNMKKSRQ